MFFVIVEQKASQKLIYSTSWTLICSQSMFNINAQKQTFSFTLQIVPFCNLFFFYDDYVQNQGSCKLRAISKKVIMNQ